MISETGPSTSEFLFGPSMDEPLAMSRSGLVYYYSVDGLGTIALLGDLVDPEHKSYVFDAWGALRAQEGSLENPFGFTAREFSEAELRSTELGSTRLQLEGSSRRTPLGCQPGHELVPVCVQPASTAQRPPWTLWNQRLRVLHNNVARRLGESTTAKRPPLVRPVPQVSDPDPNDPWDWEGWPRCTRKCLQDCDRTGEKDVISSTNVRYIHALPRTLLHTVRGTFNGRRSNFLRREGAVLWRIADWGGGWKELRC